MTRYEGTREADGSTRVTRNGDVLSPKPSQHIRNHSPDGFEWGYGGSGPAQLALALLLDATGDPETAQELYQDFKWAVVGKWSQTGGWSITSAEILEWVRQKRAQQSA